MTELYTPNLRSFWKAIVAMLAAQTTKPVALARVPDAITFDDHNLLTDPYLIVTPLIVSVFAGGWAAPDEAATIPVQFTSVGRNDDQAQWMADLARQTLLGRAASGAFTNVITVADAAVVDRRAKYLGGPEPAGGGLWQVIDTFDLEITVA